MLLLLLADLARNRIEGAGPDAAISQRHGQPKAYALAYSRQVMWRPAANQLPAPVAIDRIFWLHVPKCGSSFTHTIFHYACARPVSWSCGNGVHHPPPDYCGTNRSTIQEQMHVGNYHTPIRWVQGMGGRFEPRANVGNVVAVFRSPAQRLLSAFSYMKQMPFCCTSDWGMGPANGYKRASVLKMPDAATLARLPYSQGCMTKMIIGFRCFDDHTLTDKEMERARRFVDEGIWHLSVCKESGRAQCAYGTPALVGLSSKSSCLTPAQRTVRHTNTRCTTSPSWRPSSTTPTLSSTLRRKLAFGVSYAHTRWLSLHARRRYYSTQRRRKRRGRRRCPRRVRKPTLDAQLSITGLRLAVSQCRAPQRCRLPRTGFRVYSSLHTADRPR